MLTRVSCSNFRGFRQFDAPVGPVTAFLGPNSAGKTTVLHAIRLATHLLREALGSGPSPRLEADAEGNSPWVVVTRDALVSGAGMLPLADWRALFVDQEVGEGLFFSITLQFEAGDTIEVLSVQVACARNQQLKLDVRVRCPAAVAAVAGLPARSPLVGQRLAATVEAAAPEAVLVPPFYGTVLNEEYRARVVIDRLLGSGDQSHAVRNLVASLDGEQFLRLNSFLTAALGATITYRTTSDALQTESPLQVRFADSNGSIEISAAGAGLINLVALYCALTRWRSTAAQRPVIFLLDEPEAHLHPRLQADATARVSRLVVDEFGAQLVLATHSVDILNRLADDGAALLRVDRTASPSVVVMDDHARLFEELRSWADLTPYTAINFLAARRVLFCEGEGDREALGLLGRLRFRNDPVRLRRFQGWTRSRLQGVANQPIARLLANLIRNEAVAVQAGSEAFRLIVVLDRDYTREPGLRSERDGNVDETTVVWSRHSIESVLLRPETLEAWVRAWIETWRSQRPAERAGFLAPPALPADIRAALAAADIRVELQARAVEQLTAAMATRELLDENGRPLGGEKKVIHAMRRAEVLVSAAPEVWQRGKSRAAAVLGALRETLALPAKNQFPTDILQLLAQTDANRVGDSLAAVPAEVADLLDRMAER